MPHELILIELYEILYVLVTRFGGNNRIYIDRDEAIRPGCTTNHSHHSLHDPARPFCESGIRAAGFP